MISPLLGWLREHTAAWRPSIVGVFREQSPHDWPLTAVSPEDLRDKLTRTATSSLSRANRPRSPTSWRSSFASTWRSGCDHRRHRIEGTERSYPDLEFSGDAFGGGLRAVDIKCARRKVPAGKSPTTLNNRIALYTGNTYFLWPQLKFCGIIRPFDEYQELISIVVIYTFEPELPERITDVEVVVHETWRIASTAGLGYT